MSNRVESLLTYFCSGKCDRIRLCFDGGGMFYLMKIPTFLILINLVSRKLRYVFLGLFWGSAILTLFMSTPLLARTVPAVLSYEFVLGGSCSSYAIANMTYQAVELDDVLIKNQLEGYKYWAPQRHRHYDVDGSAPIIGGNSGLPGAAWNATVDMAIDNINLAIFGSENPVVGTVSDYVSPSDYNHNGGCAPAGVGECWAAWISAEGGKPAVSGRVWALPYGQCVATVPPFDLVCEALLRDSVVDFGSVKVGSSGRRTQGIEVSCNNSAYYSLSVVGSPDGVLTFDEGRVLITRDDGQPLPIEGEVQGGNQKKFVGLDIDATFEKAGQVEWGVKLVINYM